MRFNKTNTTTQKSIKALRFKAGHKILESAQCYGAHVLTELL